VGISGSRICGFVFEVIYHGGKPHDWHDLTREWSFEPLVLFSLFATGCLFAVGFARLWRESTKRKSERTWNAVYFVGGWFALFIALVSPLHAWGRVLFSVHMTQHEILMLVAAPLLVLSRPLVTLLWAFPVNVTRRIGNLGKTAFINRGWQWLTVPLVAWLFHAAALWTWHIPVLFEAVLRSEWVHTLQHLSFLVSALLFWWALIHGPRGVHGYGAAVLYVFTTSLHSGLLGAFITFASTVWYPSYVGLTDTWGFSALEDQQLGGLIMWIPAGLIYVFAGMLLLQGWLRESELRMRSEQTAV
jgi:cytochrome c oxidase assembly factor CtaG